MLQPWGNITSHNVNNDANESQHIWLSAQRYVSETWHYDDSKSKEQPTMPPKF